MAKKLENLSGKANRHLYIRAIDNGLSPQEETIVLTVQITNQKNSPPKVEVEFMNIDEYEEGEPPKKGFRENQSIEENIAIVTCSDPDGTDNVKCYMKKEADDDSNLFNLQEGYASLGSGSTVYFLKSPESFDREEKDVYTITIVAKDRMTNKEYESMHFIHILDDNDNPPKFDKGLKVFNLNEDLPHGALPINRLSATDADIGIGASLHYSFAPRAKKYDHQGKVVEIDSEDLPMRIDPQGALILVNDLDAEKVLKYEVYAVVKDGGRMSGQLKSRIDNDIKSYSDKQLLRFFIKDVNEHLPKFTQSSPINWQIQEGNSPDAIVGKIGASDLDRQSDIVFEMIRDSFDPPLNSKAEIPFRILPTKIVNKGKKNEYTEADIVARYSLDREYQDFYNFKIRALDKNRSGKKACKNSSSCASIISIRVSVEDLNDNSPELCREYYKRQNRNMNSEHDYCATDKQKLNLKFVNTTAGGMIATLDVADADFGDNGRLNVEIIQQKRKWESDDNNSLKLFAVNPDDMTHIEVVRDLTENDVGPYLITVKVSDSGKPEPRSVEGIINLYLNSVEKPLNQTEASYAFEKRPDFLKRLQITAGSYYRGVEDFVKERGIPGEMAIVFIALAALLFMVLLILIVWCCYRSGCCCCCNDSPNKDQDNTGDANFKNGGSRSSYKQGQNTMQEAGYSGLPSNYKDQIPGRNNGDQQVNNNIISYDAKVTDYEQMAMLQQNGRNDQTSAFGLVDANQMGYNDHFNSRGAYPEGNSNQPLLDNFNYNSNYTNGLGMGESNHGTFKKSYGNYASHPTGQMTSGMVDPNKLNNNSGSSNNNNQTTNTSPGGQSSQQNHLSPNGLAINNYNANYTNTMDVTTPMMDVNNVNGFFDQQMVGGANNLDPNNLDCLPAPPIMSNNNTNNQNNNNNRQNFESDDVPGQHTTFGV